MEAGADEAAADGAEEFLAPGEEEGGVGGGAVDFGAEGGEFAGEVGGEAGVDAVDAVVDHGAEEGLGVAVAAGAVLGLLDFFEGFEVGALGGGGEGGVVADEEVAVVDAGKQVLGSADGVGGRGGEVDLDLGGRSGGGGGDGGAGEALEGGLEGGGGGGHRGGCRGRGAGDGLEQPGGEFGARGFGGPGGVGAVVDAIPLAHGAGVVPGRGLVDAGQAADGVAAVDGADAQRLAVVVVVRGDLHPQTVRGPQRKGRRGGFAGGNRGAGLRIHEGGGRQFSPCQMPRVKPPAPKRQRDSLFWRFARQKSAQREPAGSFWPSNRFLTPPGGGRTPLPPLSRGG